MMMRLIDADNLKPDAQWDGFYNCYSAFSISQIDDAPTVKAVPIEKIKTLINDIEVMRTSPALIDNDDVQKFAENVLYALNMLIEGSGKEQANANQHNSNALNALEGDAISRQAVNEIINDIRDCISVEGYCAILERLKKLPSVKQEPKTGHWIEKDGFDGDGYYDCSECGESWTTIEGTPWQNGMNYCPNCGARMESEG